MCGSLVLVVEYLSKKVLAPANRVSSANVFIATPANPPETANDRTSSLLYIGETILPPRDSAVYFILICHRR
jgi:hypothetical protein